MKRLVAGRQGLGHGALDAKTYAALLQACGDKRDLAEGRRIHEHIVTNGCGGDTLLANLVVRMYGRCGNPELAAQTFNSIVRRNLYSWTMALAADAHNGQGKRAIALLHAMQLEGEKPNAVTLTNALAACCHPSMLRLGIWVNALIDDQSTREDGSRDDVILVAALITMYAKCGSLQRSLEVFAAAKSRNVFCWTSMIGAFVQHGLNEQAIGLYKRMEAEGVRPNKVTFITVLGACYPHEFVHQGISVHKQAVSEGCDTDVVVGTAIVNMYGKCGFLAEARQAFDRICSRNVVSWNVMVTAYVHQGYFVEALDVYKQMQREVQPDKVTFLAVLEASAGLGDLQEGRRTHTRCWRLVPGNPDLRNTLINMYSKCGCLQDARAVFQDGIQLANVVSWNSMISSYAQNGKTDETLQLFKSMANHGVRPDKITFVNLLFACSHAGVLPVACTFFGSMSVDYCLSPGMEHYSVVLDLLARLGMAEHAESLAWNMPFHPSDATWLSVLGAYADRSESVCGRRSYCVAERITELDPENSAPYVLLYNILRTELG